jgi:hypothetical protein
MPRARPLNEVIYWIPKINANAIAVRLIDFYEIRLLRRVVPSEEGSRNAGCRRIDCSMTKRRL